MKKKKKTDVEKNRTNDHGIKILKDPASDYTIFLNKRKDYYYILLRIIILYDHRLTDTVFQY